MENDQFQELVLNQFERLNNRLDTFETTVLKIDSSQVRMENELMERVRALFDARDVQQNANEQVTDTLNRIEAKIDVLQLETAHLRRVK